MTSRGRGRPPAWDSVLGYRNKALLAPVQHWERQWVSPAGCTTAYKVLKWVMVASADTEQEEAKLADAATVAEHAETEAVAKRKVEAERAEAEAREAAAPNMSLLSTIQPPKENGLPASTGAGNQPSVAPTAEGTPLVDVAAAAAAAAAALTPSGTATPTLSDATDPSQRTIGVVETAAQLRHPLAQALVVSEDQTADVTAAEAMPVEADVPMTEATGDAFPAHLHTAVKPAELPPQ
ncbi:uncharacterized protein L969DRAFT_83725 [Mixia osmundae IAM 14324]|uniref:Uncharacterized protein n=1 Tax=Mixia osmundae (strain CBS 9802 / IAM 14324 / JCM 22182 / KY 12970) TaxID=764103 RepID=G7E3Q7_MIXOS|nr:uncharacterized protein L969DRAFT_83725 [Mixia osmundae IAM 14324]KEI41873.1 hypothetical protein L969DRAFT_83725 [Mixia osmundae IAM 14324]GAA97467.1 hypothetical protein E5Q_04146 [Mixia osmundae IAM 14324]